MDMTLRMPLTQDSGVVADAEQGKSALVLPVTLTCQQVLVFVDLKLKATEAFRGFRVDVLHVGHLTEASVHLWAKGNMIMRKGPRPQAACCCVVYEFLVPLHSLSVAGY